MGIYSYSANNDNLIISKIISGFDNKEEKEKKKQIVWIDQNVNNLENKFTLEYLQKVLKDDYKIATLESVNEAFQLFEIKKKVLFYIIVSGRLAEEYFNNYAEKVIDMNILSASTIYCYNESYHKKKLL